MPDSMRSGAPDPSHCSDSLLLQGHNADSAVPYRPHLHPMKPVSLQCAADHLLLCLSCTCKGAVHLGLWDAWSSRGHLMRLFDNLRPPLEPAEALNTVFQCWYTFFT